MTDMEQLENIYSGDDLDWQCSICTLLNHVDRGVCSACGNPRVHGANHNFIEEQQSLLSSLAQSPKPPVSAQPISLPSPRQQQQQEQEQLDVAVYQEEVYGNVQPKLQIERSLSAASAASATAANEDTKEDDEQNEEVVEDEIVMDKLEESLPDDFGDECKDADDAAFDDDDAFDDAFDDDDNGDGWGDDDDELCYDDQKTIEYDEEEDCAAVLKRALEKRRLANSKLEAFWKCGKCQFLNHPSRAVCMMCAMPQLDVVHHIMTCPKDELKVCPRCSSYLVPHMYDDHVLDCNPIGALDNAEANQAWFVKLTPCEQHAINHVNTKAMQKSEKNEMKLKLIKLIKSIGNGKYVDRINDVIQALYHFLEWEVPIIIRVHVADLIPKLLADTHYRNLFEIGKGSGNNDQKVRAEWEKAMFSDVYDRARAFERPKYGCLNVGLTSQGTQQAKCYGDGYFVMNDTTVRWRTTLTVQDSSAVKGKCGTVKHCNHLLTDLQPQELEEMIEVALSKSASKGDKQRSYREIQIHGPVQLNRDVLSLNVPNAHRNNKALVRQLEMFCESNLCKLVWF